MTLDLVGPPRRQAVAPLWSLIGLVHVLSSGPSHHCLAFDSKTSRPVGMLVIIIVHNTRSVDCLHTQVLALDIDREPKQIAVPCLTGL